MILLLELAKRAVSASTSGEHLRVSPEEFNILKSMTETEWNAAVLQVPGVRSLALAPVAVVVVGP